MKPRSYERPDGGFPAEDLVREVLDNETVDTMLRQAEAALGSPSEDPPALRLVQ